MLLLRLPIWLVCRDWHNPRHRRYSRLVNCSLHNTYLHGSRTSQGHCNASYTRTLLIPYRWRRCIPIWRLISEWVWFLWWAIWQMPGSNAIREIICFWRSFLERGEQRILLRRRRRNSPLCEGGLDLGRMRQVVILDTKSQLQRHQVRIRSVIMAINLRPRCLRREIQWVQS